MSLKSTSKTTILTKDEVIHIASLAKITLSDDEIEKFRQQLSTILDYVTVLNSVDITDIEPTRQITGLTNVLREDSIKPSLNSDEVLRNAPQTNDGYFKIPKVLE